MNNKKLIYILVPLALLIWGLILFRIFRQVGNKPEMLFQQGDTADKSYLDQTSDTFALSLDYNDPFLDRKLQGRTSSSSAYGRQTATVASAVPETSAPEIPWPEIEYGGLIENRNKNLEICLLRIDGVNYLMSAGETNKNVKLISSFKDSIVLEIANKRRTYYKKRI